MASSRFHLTVVQFLTLIAFPISSFAVQTLTDNPNFDPEIAVLGDAKFVDDYSHVQLTGQWLRSVPYGMHSLPADPRGYGKVHGEGFGDHKRSICPLRILAGLIFATGCAALLAFVMLFVWAIVVNKHTEFPTKIQVHPEDFKYEKIIVVEDEDGKGVQG
ncbi:hypothetical protein Q3G72_010024 [Acer saccharum]|nr:hypothetical protein Q3G72_010024 [Acer saccharum]